MRLLQSFKMAWHAVSANKLRTFLTMLGIMIGVVALVVLVSIADGATTSVTDEISGMGSSYLTVTISDDKENPLKLSEISGFAEPDEVDAAAPMARTSVTAKSGYTSESMTLIGTTGRYLDIQKMEIQYGRFIKNADVENNTSVVVPHLRYSGRTSGKGRCRRRKDFSQRQKLPGYRSADGGQFLFTYKGNKYDEQQF